MPRATKDETYIVLKTADEFTVMPTWYCDTSLDLLDLEAKTSSSKPLHGDIKPKFITFCTILFVVFGICTRIRLQSVSLASMATLDSHNFRRHWLPVLLHRRPMGKHSHVETIHRHPDKKLTSPKVTAHVWKIRVLFFQGNYHVVRLQVF